MEDGEVQSYFDTVQINEWINNEERTSDFEHVMDSIDAYDLSRSQNGELPTRFVGSLLGD